MSPTFAQRCSQQSSPSPQGQLLVPQTRSPAHSLSASQSPSPSEQKPAAPVLQHWSLPRVSQAESFPLPSHNPIVVVVVVIDVVVVIVVVVVDEMVGSAQMLRTASFMSLTLTDCHNITSF